MASRPKRKRQAKKQAGTSPKSTSPATNVGERSMAEDQEEVGSIVEYSEDVSEQEAPEPLPVGNYEGVIKSVENKKSKKDNLYADVVFHIGIDQFPADYAVENNPEGCSIHYRTVSLEDTAKARYGVRRFLEAIGAKGGKKIDTSEWVGLAAKVNVAHGEWEGQKREEIKSVTAL